MQLAVHPESTSAGNAVLPNAMYTVDRHLGGGLGFKGGGEVRY